MELNKMIERMIQFGPPKNLPTPKGLRTLRKGRATRGFWEFWQSNFAAIRDAGYTVQMDSLGRWWVKQWSYPEAPSINPEDYPGIPKHVLDKLLHWQPQAVADLVRIIRDYQFALDASEAGTGKTAVTCATAAVLHRPLSVVCQKYATPGWEWMAERFGIKLQHISHYELVRESKTELGKWVMLDVQLKTKVKQVPFFQWNVELRKSGTILAVDEIHNCGGIDTKNSGMAISTKKCGISTIGISATATDTPVRMKALAYLLDILKNPDLFYAWAHRNGCTKSYQTLVFGDRNDIHNEAKKHKVMEGLHQIIFGGGRAIRVLKKDIPGFPRNQIIVEPINCGNNTKEIGRQYAAIQQTIERLSAHACSRREAAKSIAVGRQCIELSKVPTVAEIAQDLISQGKQVVIFVNYRETAIALGKALKVPIMIGGQAEDERLRVMNQFQQGVHRATVSTYGAGSESINLQDEYGLGAREGILFPCFRVQFLVQAMNRYNRATSKTPSITRFLYAYGTAEVTTMMRLRSKKSLMDTLNDGESIPLPSPVDGEI